MEFSNSLRRLAMEALEDKTEPYELKSFSRKLNPDHIKAMNKDILLSSPGVGTYLILSFVAILAASIIIYLNT